MPPKGAARFTRGLNRAVLDLGRRVPCGPIHFPYQVTLLRILTYFYPDSISGGFSTFQRSSEYKRYLKTLRGPGILITQSIIHCTLTSLGAKQGSRDSLAPIHFVGIRATTIASIK